MGKKKSPTPTAERVRAEIATLLEADADGSLETELVHSMVQPLFPEARYEASKIVNQIIMESRNGIGPFRMDMSGVPCLILADGDSALPAGRMAPRATLPSAEAADAPCAGLEAKVIQRMDETLRGGCMRLLDLVQAVVNMFDLECKGQAQLLCLDLAMNSPRYSRKLTPFGYEICAT